MSKTVVILLSFIGICCSQSIPELEDFSERFANHSCTVQPKIHDMSDRNGDVRLELIHWIVTELGNLTVEMRRITNDSWTRIEQHKLMKDRECQYKMRYLRDYYVAIGEQDIMKCAYDMSYYMWHDSVYRFIPRAQFVKRENSRVIHQSVQVMGRNNLVEGRERVPCDLQNKLVYFENQWITYEELLGVELEFIKLYERLVRDEMAWWNNYALSWHTLFMGLLEGSVDYYCGDDTWW